MLALREFTADQVAELAGVKRASVHTVRRRDDGWVDRVGQVRTGRRGGQLVRYRLRPVPPSRNPTILRESRRPGRHLQASAQPIEISPIELVDAQSILLDRLPPEPDPGLRAILLESARDLVEAGGDEARQSSVGADTSSRRGCCSCSRRLSSSPRAPMPRSGCGSS